MPKVVILGAGEHGRKAEAHCHALDYDVLGFLDDTYPVDEQINGVPVLGGFALAMNGGLDGDVRFYVALGDTKKRIVIGQRLMRAGRQLQTLVHPKAEVTRSAEIGTGSAVGVFALVCVNAQIGDCVIIHDNASVGPDARVMGGASIGPRSFVGRAAEIGAGTLIGIRATVLPEVRVGDHSVIGAGSLVTKDVPDNSVAYGSPCRVVRPND